MCWAYFAHVAVSVRGYKQMITIPGIGLGSLLQAA